MSEPFQPNKGDTVEFYNEEAELWEPGTVFSSGADRRHYFVQPDDEAQPMHVVNYTHVRPLTEPEPAAPSFWEAAKEAVRNYYAATEAAQRQYDRAEGAERSARVHRLRQQSIAQERNRWASQAGENAARARIAEKRAEELQAQLDAAPYATGYPVGDRVAARLAEYRERTHAAEERADKLVRQLADTVERAEKAEAARDNARAAIHQLIGESAEIEKERDGLSNRVEELEDQLRIQKSRADAAMNRAREGEGWQHELQVETHRRLEWMKLAHAAQSREAELKAALRTLGGESK